MEGLARLVSESLARHGVEATFDHRRLQWSNWFLCEDSVSVLMVPGQPGLFALAEEVMAPGETAATGGKRMLALFQISEAADVGMALGLMFLPGNPLHERLASGRCFARYSIIEDASQRQVARTALEQWLASSAETASGVGPTDSRAGGVEPQASQERSLSSLTASAVRSSNKEAQIGSPSSIPAGF